MGGASEVTKWTPTKSSRPFSEVAGDAPGNNSRDFHSAEAQEAEDRASHSSSANPILTTSFRAHNFPAPLRPRRTIIKIDQIPLLKLPSTYCQKSNRYEHLVCHVKTPL